MNLKTIFFNDLGRLRSGWRCAVFLLSYVAGTILLVGGAVAALKSLPVGYADFSLESLLVGFGGSFAVVLFFGWLYGRVFEDVPFRALGFGRSRGWFRNLVWGFALGAVSLAFAALVAVLPGGLTLSYNHAAGTSGMALTLGTTFVIFTVGAAYEEAFLRGYPLQTFGRAGLALFGTFFTALLFATMHNANPGATAFSWFNTFLAGIWFAAAYFKTRDLWFPFGIHLAWNWFQGAVFGISVSGLDRLAPAPVMRATDHGPAWLTGGGYGLEGGLACTIALAASTAAIYFLPRLAPDPETLAHAAEKRAE